ncbi:hypothetical protein [Actinacidiphila glaucinigra]|uniref:hypothetical protein n=1 Tax=Actinacidiphila glaucinigra TaxID=235986 RepID=UPI0036E1048E
MIRPIALAAAAALAAGAAFISAVPGSSAPRVERVRAGDLGPGGPWFRLQDQPGNGDRSPGVQEVSPFADPVRFNGSLHLAVTGDQQSQAAHPFTARVPLATIAASELSYDSFVTTGSVTGTAANLQLPVICAGGFTTLSFQPQLATDSQGRQGVVRGVWQHFVNGPASLWRTSRPAGTIPAQADRTLAEYIAACTGAGDGVDGVIANAGRLGQPNAGLTLDTYVDNLTVHGTTYDFLVDGRTTARISLGNSTPGGPCHAASGQVVFTDPADGPAYRSVGIRLILARTRGIDPGDVTVTVGGTPLVLTPGPGDILVGTYAPSPAVDLDPGGTFGVPVSVTFNNGPYTADDAEPAGTAGGPGGQGHRGGTLTLTAHLLALGYEPLQFTGVAAVTTLRG